MNEDTVRILDAIAAMARRIEALEAKSEKSGPRTIWEINKIIEAKTKVMDTLRHKSFLDVAGGGHWNNEKDRSEFSKLRKEVNELNRQIAAM